MVTLIGVFAAVLTTSCWAPQVSRTLRRGTAADFAWPYLGLLAVGLAGWCVYGALRHNMIILVSNAVVFGCAMVVVAVKLRSHRYTFEHVELVLRGGEDPVTALESLVEIGPRLAADLRNVGIADLRSLRSVGTEEANRRLVEAGLQTGSHSKKAIQGAIAGDWGTASPRNSTHGGTPGTTDPTEPRDSVLRTGEPIERRRHCVHGATEPTEPRDSVLGTSKPSESRHTVRRTTVPSESHPV